MTTSKFDFSNYEISIQRAVKLLASLPIKTAGMFWGEPGIGKTKTIYDIFSTVDGKPCEIINVLAGCSEPTDFSGIPFFMQSEFSRYAPPEWAFRCSKKAEAKDQGPKVIFLDDVVTGHEQTQAALYKMVHERHIGNAEFRDNVRIIAAGNRLGDKSAVQDMPMALGNRFIHFFTKVDWKEWVEWAKENGIHPFIISYIRCESHHISTFAEAVVKNSELKAFATPRSWEMLSDSLFAIEKNNSFNEDLFTLSIGCVGTVGFNFGSFVKHNARLVPAEEIVKDPHGARMPAIEELSIMHSTISALEFHLTRHPEHWLPALLYSFRIPQEMTDLGVILARHIIHIVINKLAPNDRVKAINSKEFTKMYNLWIEGKVVDA